MKPKQGLIPTIALISGMAVSGFTGFQSQQPSLNLEQRINVQNHSQETNSGEKSNNAIQDSFNTQVKTFRINQTPVFTFNEGGSIEEALVSLYSDKTDITSQELLSIYLEAVDMTLSDFRPGFFYPQLNYFNGDFQEPLDFPIQIKITDAPEILFEHSYPDKLNEHSKAVSNNLNHWNIPKFTTHVNYIDIKVNYLDSPFDTDGYHIKLVKSYRHHNIETPSDLFENSIRNIFDLGYESFQEFEKASDEEINERIWENNYETIRINLYSNPGRRFFELMAYDINSFVWSGSKIHFVVDVKSGREQIAIDWNKGNIEQTDPKVGKGTVSFDLGTQEFNPEDYLLIVSSNLFRNDCYSSGLNPNRLFCRFDPDLYESGRIRFFSLENTENTDEKYDGYLSMP